MALQQKFTKVIHFLPDVSDERILAKIDKIKTENVEYDNAYFKISLMTGDKNDIRFELTVYDKKDGITLDRDHYAFVPDLDENSGNFIKQGYEYLKTLDEFKNAEDC